MNPKPITQQTIFLAQQRIRPLVRHTPLVPVPTLSRQTGRHIYSKLETLQPTHSFKLRGASNKLLSLTEAQRQRGVVAVSTGNHGRAVAYVAQQIGLTATICLSERVPANKVEALRQLGATVVIHGQSQDEAAEKAADIIATQGATLALPFDDPLIIAGQGTIGLEILLDLPQVDTVLVPLSGGGLISGVALALKTANPAIRVIGVCMEGGAAMQASLQAGQPVQLAEVETLADSLQGGIGLENQYTFGMVQCYVDAVVLLSEAEIAAGMLFALREHQQIVEGGGAVGLAALLAEKIPDLGDHVVCVVSGGNVALPQLLALVDEPA